MPEMKHTMEELEAMRSLSMEDKVDLTKDRIKEWIDAHNGRVYVGFSGGKDSTVLLHIARRVDCDIPAVYCDTGLEYPEIREFVKSIDNVTWLKPEKNFRRVIGDYGYPVVSKETAKRLYELRNYNLSDEYRNKLLGKGRKAIPQKWRGLIDAPFGVSSKCCDIMKKHPFVKYERESGRAGIIGTMAEEGSLRLNSWLRYGCNAFEMKGRTLSRPMSFWTEQDVLEYLHTYDIPYCSVYGAIEEENGRLHMTGCQRTGCMFCMFGVHLEKEPNRFQKMKISHPVQYEYCMREREKGGLGLDKVLDFIDVPH